MFTRNSYATRALVVRMNVGMVRINVPIALAYPTFGGWKRSGFGDADQQRPERVKSRTNVKAVIGRRPYGGDAFALPTTA